MFLTRCGCCCVSLRIPFVFGVVWTPVGVIKQKKVRFLFTLTSFSSQQLRWCAPVTNGIC